MGKVPVVIVLDDDNDDLLLATEALLPLVVSHVIILQLYSTIGEVVAAIKQRACPAVCIVDYHLSDINDKWESIKIIRDACPTTFFVAMSGTNDPNALKAFINADGRRILAKNDKDFSELLRRYTLDGLRPWRIWQKAEEIASKHYE